MRQLSLIRLLLLGVTLYDGGGQPAESANELSPGAHQRLNVLFILTDNQPASILGTYGNTDVRTPHIDQLASEGVQFNHAFSVNGMCSPTRATLKAWRPTRRR